MRSDRDTVVIGAGELSEAAEVAINAEAAGQATALTWNVAPSPPATTSTPSWPRWWNKPSRTTGHLGHARHGRAHRAAGMFAAGGHGLVELGRQAVAAGNLTNAETLAKEALQPRSPRSGGPRPARGRAVGPGRPRPRRAAARASPGPAAAADAQFPAEEQAFDEQGRLLNAFETQRRLLAQSLQADVQDALNQARGVMGDQPELAQTDLKLVRERVLRAEIEPELRAQLLAQIDTSLRHASRLVIEHEQREAELAQSGRRPPRRTASPRT
ncbi:MAG: hypothetical protein U0836_07565 [Pirellulales bacterium]